MIAILLLLFIIYILLNKLLINLYFNEGFTLSNKLSVDTFKKPLCMDIINNGMNYTIMNQCNNSDSQKWTIAPITKGSKSYFIGNSFVKDNEGNPMCLSISENDLIMDTCDPSNTSEQWTITNHFGLTGLQNNSNQLCMDVNQHNNLKLNKCDFSIKSQNLI